MTAREIAYELGFLERNATAPRLSEMQDNGVVEIVGKKIDRVTKKTVSVYRRVV